MVKKSLFKKVFKKKKKKTKVEPKKSISPGKFKLFILKYKAKIKAFFKKVSKAEKLKDMKKFFIVITGYGLILNYSLHFILGTRFTLFTMFAWGIAYYFINQELVEWIRRIIAKR